MACRELAGALLCALIAVDGLDVIVVGAGMGGISAAGKLQAEGHSVTLLEGRDRLGGRTWTDTSLGFPADFGASWVHGASAQNPLTAVVQGLNLRTEDHPDKQLCRYDEDGVKYSANKVAKWELWCWDAEPGHGATGTLEQFLRSYDPAFFNTVEGEMCLAGWDFNEGSAVDLVSAAKIYQSEVEETGGPEWLMLDGYVSLVNGLVRRFQSAGGTVKTGAKVTQVEYCMGFGDVSCTANVTYTENGSSVTQSADAVVVAVPLGVLQKQSITFVPALPTSHSAAIGRMQFGVVNKAVAVFDTDFWSTGCNNELMLAINQPGANIDNRGIFPYFMNVNKAWPSTNALLGFATGRYAIASEQKSDAEVQADFMSRIRQQFPNAPEPTQFKRTQWSSDEFAYGSYTSPSGINAEANELRALEQAVSASLTLAGEHTSPLFAATVHGAYQSGQRAATDVINGMPSASALSASKDLPLAVLLMALVLSW